MCGDNLPVLSPAHAPIGTPPRVWGQREPIAFNVNYFRNTPTCVGTTATAPYFFVIFSEHPHVCGDNDFIFGKQFLACGTPPRVWGQLRRWTGAWTRPKEHPHVCGDNDASGSRGCDGHGTPPRVWGQRSQLDHLSYSSRNTPTCVGTTCFAGVGWCGCAEHPHVCGDNDARMQSGAVREGTPPRVWGQRAQKAGETPRLRNTPTCVGTTPFCYFFGGGTTEHPHVCGDNYGYICGI